MEEAASNSVHSVTPSSLHPLTDELKSRIIAKKGELAELRSQLIESTETLHQAQLRKRESEQVNWSEKLHQVRSRVSELTSQLRGQPHSELKRLEEHYQRISVVHQSVCREAESQAVGLAELEKQFEEGRSTLRSRKSVLRLVKQSIVDLRSQIVDDGGLSAQVWALQAELDESDALIDQLTEERDVLDDHLHGLQTDSTMQRLTSECEQLHAKLRMDEQRLREFKNSIPSILEKEQQAIQSQREVLIAEYEKQRNRQSQLEREISGLKAAAKDLEKDLRLAEDTVQKYGRDRAELLDRLRSVDADNVETLLGIS
jgi:chromosome segregation ATPase